MASHVLLQIVEVRDRIDTGSLTRHLLEQADLALDPPTVERVIERSLRERLLNRALVSAAGDSRPLRRAIRFAANQTAFWLAHTGMDGIPLPKRAEDAKPVCAHYLLWGLERRLREQEKPTNEAGRLTQLANRIQLLEKRLTWNARNVVRRVRANDFPQVLSADIRLVSSPIAVAFPELQPVQIRACAEEALGQALNWVAASALETYDLREWYLKRPELPSKYIANVAFYRLRHVLMSRAEDALLRLP